MPKQRKFRDQDKPNSLNTRKRKKKQKNKQYEDSI